MDRKRIVALTLLVTVSVLLPGYGGGESTQSTDLPAKITARGTLVIATDPDYPPQSKLKPGAKRAANTKCAATEQTANEYMGFFGHDTAIYDGSRYRSDAASALFDDKII